MSIRPPCCYSSCVAANIYQAVKQAMQDLIAPQIESLKGDFAAVRAEIGAVRADIARVDDKLSSEIRRVDEKLGTEIRRIDDKLTWALDLRERIVAIEARLGSTARS